MTAGVWKRKERMEMIWLWLGAVVVFGVVEALTTGLVSIWFVVGAAAALFAALADAAVVTQLVVFAVVSAVALAVTRPLVKKMVRKKAEPTNADRVLGELGQVTETIDNVRSTGAVYVDGKTWTARSAGNEVIPAGERVRILSIEGVKLLVEPSEKLEGVIV
jgi:membrane protein implicated in regulation of membrane protease activity